MISKIYAVWVYAKDLAESREFYEKKLGLKFKFQNEDWMEFAMPAGRQDLGETSFAILQRRPEQGPVKPQKTRIMLQVDENLEDFVKELKENSVKFVTPVRYEGYGKLITFEDPNGHWLELFEPK